MAYLMRKDNGEVEAVYVSSAEFKILREWSARAEGTPEQFLGYPVYIIPEPKPSSKPTRWKRIKDWVIDWLISLAPKRGGRG